MIFSTDLVVSQESQPCPIKNGGYPLPILVEERCRGIEEKFDWFSVWKTPLPVLSEDLAFQGTATAQSVGAFANTQIRKRAPASA